MFDNIEMRSKWHPMMPRGQKGVIEHSGDKERNAFMDTVKQLSVVALLVVTTVTLVSGCSFLGQKKSEVISMNELPAAVKPLADKETAGCKIIEVEKEMKNGKVIYAITYDQAGIEMEVEYAPDGTLISKGKE